MADYKALTGWSADAWSVVQLTTPFDSDRAGLEQVMQGLMYRGNATLQVQWKPVRAQTTTTRFSPNRVRSGDVQDRMKPHCGLEAAKPVAPSLN